RVTDMAASIMPSRPSGPGSKRVEGPRHGKKPPLPFVPRMVSLARNPFLSGEAVFSVPSPSRSSCSVSVHADSTPECAEGSFSGSSGSCTVPQFLDPHRNTFYPGPVVPPLIPDRTSSDVGTGQEKNVTL